MHRLPSTISVPIAAFLLWQSSALAQKPIQDDLYQRAVKATKCEDIPNNGKYCSYNFGSILAIGIKDVGGSDTVVGFHNSNIKNELYAILYFGCIAIVPGETHTKNYSKDYGVHISPKNGMVYKTSTQCKASL